MAMQRYDGYSEPVPDGDFVKFNDVQALLARCRELEEVVREYMRTCTACNFVFAKPGSKCRECAKAMAVVGEKSNTDSLYCA